MIDWVIDWLADWLIDWLGGLLSESLIGWVIDWLIDLLIDWLIIRPIALPVSSFSHRNNLNFRPLPGLCNLVLAKDRILSSEICDLILTEDTENIWFICGSAYRGHLMYCQMSRITLGCCNSSLWRMRLRYHGRWGMVPWLRTFWFDWAWHSWYKLWDRCGRCLVAFICGWVFWTTLHVGLCCYNENLDTMNMLKHINSGKPRWVFFNWSSPFTLYRQVLSHIKSQTLLRAFQF